MKQRKRGLQGDQSPSLGGNRGLNQIRSLAIVGQIVQAAFHFHNQAALMANQLAGEVLQRKVIAASKLAGVLAGVKPRPLCEDHIVK
ncbi:MAG: hypothetical protein ACREF9_01660 [Opitutaceae bacterium]